MSVHPDHNTHCLLGEIDTGSLFLSTEQPVSDVQLLISTLIQLPLIIAQPLSVMLVSHCGEYPCECKKYIRGKFAR